MKKKIKIQFDFVLLGILLLILVLHYGKVIPHQYDLFYIAGTAVIATVPVILSTFRSIEKKKVSVDLLASIALIASLLAQEWTSAVFINLMLTSARLLGAYTERKTNSALEQLLKLKPLRAKIKSGATWKEVPVEEVKIGDTVLVELGERIPVDGKIIEGEASIDQSSFTGESIPVSKFPHDSVLSSTIVVSGHIIVLAEKIGKDTSFEKVIQLVKESQEKKPYMDTFVEKFARVYIVAMIITAVLLYTISLNSHLVLAVLLVVCADDIAIAIPLAFVAAIGNAAKQGIIIKGGSVIEALSKVKMIIVDKTGTLTRGKMKVEDFVTFNSFKESDLMKLARSACQMSNHPSSKAIVEFITTKNVDPEKAIRFKEFGGRGVCALYKGKKITVGTKTFLKSSKIYINGEMMKKVLKKEEQGFNVNLVGYGKELIGFFALSDELKEGIKETIKELREFGIQEFVMLTGDNEKVAQRIADATGIDKFYANVLPENKVKYVERHLNKKYKVAMIGDGVNDAAALGIADVGIAMGEIGSDVSIESAEIVIMDDDFRKVAKLAKLSRYIFTVVRRNFFIWGIVNFFGLLLVFMKILQPTTAAAYNFVTDFIPILNSIRLFRMIKK